ncbi:MAG: hypothetical protein JWM47_864 [Acidimicrobiales bacterium]|nr:hypothetical protein [Acidimicrobiales bacterium]
MAEHEPSGPRWDPQGLAVGLIIALVGLALLSGRGGDGLRPVHLLGIVVLGAGAALLVTAIDRPAGSGHGPDPLP